MIEALGWIFGALAIGLWYGEMQRRRATERLITYGSPAANLRHPTSTMRPSAEAEDRMLDDINKVSEETLERVTAGLMDDAKAKGIEGYTEKQARKDAELMVAGFDVGSQGAV
jgi:hypothetical protein